MQVADPRKGKAVKAFRFAVWGGCRDLAQAIKQSSSLFEYSQGVAEVRRRRGV